MPDDTRNSNLELFDKSLHEATLKVSQAARHAGMTDVLLARYAKTDFCRIKETKNPTYGHQRFVVHATQPPEDLSLCIGDFFHNLSSALDYITSGIMRIKTGSHSRMTFPSHETRSGLMDSLRCPKPGKKKTGNRKLIEACPPVEKLILEKVKPYKSGGNLVWEIRAAANIDKHNLLIPTVNVNFIDNVKIEDKARNFRFQGRVRVRGGELMNFIGYNASTAAEIINHGDAFFSLLFPDDAVVFGGQNVQKTLCDCYVSVETIIEIFKTDVRPTFSKD